MSTLDTEAEFKLNAELVYQALDNITDMVNKGTLVDSKLMVLSTLNLTRSVMMVYERMSNNSPTAMPRVEGSSSDAEDESA